MKKAVLLALFAITLSCGVFSDPLGPIGQFKSVEMQGATSFSSEEIVRALRSAPQLFVLSHAMADRDVFLNSLVEQTIRGYRHAGFPYVKVSAETSSSGDHVVLKVVEGERFTAGQVVLTGLTTIESEEVIELLTRPSQAPAFFQKPEIIEALFGSKREVDPIWQPGEPVKCTDEFLNSVNAFLRKSFAAYGRFFPKIDVSLSFDESLKQTDLHVAVLDEGPANVIGLIEINGLRHHSREEILEYIHLREGDILNREILMAAEHRLVSSGRFISVKLEPLPPDKEGDKLTLRISLQDAGNVPKLGSPLSELEQACMTFGEWLRDLPESGIDLRTSISVHETNFFSIITSASNGIFFVVSDTGFGEGSTPDIRAALLLDSGLAEFLRPSAKETLVTEARGFDLELKASVLPPDPELGREGSFFAGGGFTTADEGRISIRYEFDTPPCVFLWLAGSTNVTAVLDDSLLTIHGIDSDWKLEFNCAARRLISMEMKHFEKPITMTFEAEHGLFGQTISLAAENSTWKRIHPSGIVFLGALTTESLSIVADLPEFDEQTVQRIKRTASLLDVFVDAGHVLPSGKERKEKGDRFNIPSAPEYANNPMLLLAAFCYEQLSGLLPKESWPVVVAREAAMMTAGNLQYLESSFNSLHTGDDMGPAGCLFLSELLHSKNPAGAAAFAEKGLTLLNEDDFRKDVSLIVCALDSLSVLDPSYAYLDEVDWSRLGDTMAKMTAEEKRDQCRKDIIALQDIPANERLEVFGSALWGLWHLDETLHRKLEGLALGIPSSLNLTVEESHTGDTIQSLTKAAEEGDAEAQFNLAVMYAEGRSIAQNYTQAVKWYTAAAEQGYAAAQNNFGVMYANGLGVPLDNKQAVEWYTKAAEQGYALAQYNLGLVYVNGQGVSKDNKEAVKWITKAAEQGYVAAQNDLGVMYANGLGVPLDNKQAAEWYTKAAEQGYAAAQNDLGIMCANGLGVPRDYKKAAEWYAKGAEQGNALAQYNLGMMYYFGNGVLQDYKQAIAWFTRAAEQGYFAAQNDLGYMYDNGFGILQNYKKAIEWYTKAAEQEYAKAQYNLAQIYRHGKGVVQDYEQAVKWYTKAAEQGYAAAQQELGISYENGIGVPQDYEKAIEWYTKAAKQGHALAQDNLGYMYDYGMGVSQDHNQAFKWYAKAAEQDFPSAQNNLGCCYEKGYGVVQDFHQALKWYTKAAEQGLAEAQDNLGSMYQNGRGAPQDYKQSIIWFTYAAEQGYAGAQYNLGLMYIKGQGVSQDNKAAVKWITKAAEQGYDAAQKDLGILYENGIGVPQDYKQAIEWYTKAAEQGHADAQRALGLLYYNGQSVPQDYEQALKWYIQAAEQGDATAQNYLAYMYYSGKSVPQDYKQALKWYTRAAEQGYAQAQSQLGWMYRKGNGVSQDYGQALKWSTKAAEQGYAKAQYRLGWMHRKGEGVPQDDRQAVKWHTKAAEQGYAASQSSLAWLLATCPDEDLRDGPAAVTYALKACEQTEWKKASYIDTLAAAYAETGRFADAVKYQKMALEDPDFLESEGEEARARLELYEAGKPYRENAEGVP